MRPFYILLASLLLSFVVQAQNPTAEEILSRSIGYHDPNGVWGSYQGSFVVVMETPGQTPRYSEITMDQPADRFRLHVRRGETKKTYEWNAGTCHLSFDGKTEFSDAIAQEHRLTCDRAEMYRDYYSYLYGLPMKLRDPGTRLGPEVKRQTFHGTEYWVLEVQYDPEVGQDLWYFYFNPETYALEAYQFYHDKAKNDGEYILLEGEHRLGGMRLPRIRTWYTNKEEKLLGTDTLQNL
ncbi:MAG: hypothetical protein JSW57_06175 [Flavobacteriaceae bacterium]|nr:MAG: hypothetical protein JSW57_06175 [Flavobacteriaceae bacterium]